MTVVNPEWVWLVPGLIISPLSYRKNVDYVYSDHTRTVDSMDK